ncbi:hypothetical protein [Polyangium jinanense]|uniref:Uncharacterized protein n=1 Tax=Polyangium jinanense TaxID=2829994 RepID=A0A9X3X722_9BACT|nr:hypothetical protein [Polyangium jinanense]MDC3959112.1 hypothetical protein [Polyangium jinanense]MDC3983965.1 hypothetical protein [Polyangium jinanense]
MRNDLEKACASCELRLPATDSVCPRCRAATMPVADALRSLRGRVGKDTWLDVPRTLALYVPAALGLVAAVVVDALFLWEEVIGAPSFQKNALGVGLMMLAGLCFFGIWCLVLALPWGLWAGLVTLTFAVYRHIRGIPAPPPRLLPLPLPAPLRPSLLRRATERLDDLSKKLDAWHDGKQKPSQRIPLLVLLAAMVLAEVFAKEPAIELTSLKAFANSVGPLLIMMIPIAVVATITSIFPLYAANRTTKRLVAALRRIDERKSARLEDEPSVEPLRAGRASARGRVSQGQKPALVAPLSGKPCLAFRLVGHIDDIALDDGDAVPMTVVNGAESVEIRGERFAIALGKPEEKAGSLDTEAAARVAAFLTARGIQAEPRFVELGETCLREGDDIEAWGMAGQERTAGEGYRDVVLGRVLDDGDGLPVLITR